MANYLEFKLNPHYTCSSTVFNLKEYREGSGEFDDKT